MDNKIANAGMHLTKQQFEKLLSEHASDNKKQVTLKVTASRWAEVVDEIDGRIENCLESLIDELVTETWENSEFVDKPCCDHIYESACACCIGECDTCSVMTEDKVAVCDHCGKPMFPNLSQSDHEGYTWNCTTYGCGDFTGSEIEAEDLIAVGVPEWVAERIESLANAFYQLQDERGE